MCLLASQLCCCLQEHDHAAQPSSQEAGTSSSEGQMSEQDVADLIVVKHSRHDRVAGQQAGPHHASDDQHDAAAAQVRAKCLL